jgi:hypothetical protein
MRTDSESQRLAAPRSPGSPVVSQTTRFAPRPIHGRVPRAAWSRAVSGIDRGERLGGRSNRAMDPGYAPSKVDVPEAYFLSVLA